MLRAATQALPKTGFLKPIAGLALRNAGGFFAASDGPEGAGGGCIFARDSSSFAEEGPEAFSVGAASCVFAAKVTALGTEEGKALGGSSRGTPTPKFGCGCSGTFPASGSRTELFRNRGAPEVA